MDKKIQEKLDHFLRMSENQVNHNPGPRTPAKPDSLSSLIRTKRESDLFMAQLDAVAKLAREENIEWKKKNSENL